MTSSWQTRMTSLLIQARRLVAHPFHCMADEAAQHSDIHRFPERTGGGVHGWMPPGVRAEHQDRCESDVQIDLAWVWVNFCPQFLVLEQ